MYLFQWVVRWTQDGDPTGGGAHDSMINAVDTAENKPACYEMRTKKAAVIISLTKMRRMSNVLFQPSS